MNNILMGRLTVYILLASLLVTFITQYDAKSFAIQKKDDSLMSKIESVHQRKSAMRNYRGTQSRQVKNYIAASLLSTERNDDMLEAIIMRSLIVRLFDVIEKSLKISSGGLRILGDTVAGLISSIMRSVGGIMNILATLTNKVSDKLDYSIPKDTMGKALVSGDSRTNLVSTLKNIAKVMSGLSHACIWGGEITESLTLGLGEAVQDSFRGLELITRAGNQAINFMFLNDFTHDAVNRNPADVPQNKSIRSLSHTIHHMPNLVISEEDMMNEDITHEHLEDDEVNKSPKNVAVEVQNELAQIRKQGFTASRFSHDSGEKHIADEMHESHKKRSKSMGFSIVRDGVSDFGQRLDEAEWHNDNQSNHGSPFSRSFWERLTSILQYHFLRIWSLLMKSSHDLVTFLNPVSLISFITQSNQDTFGTYHGVTWMGLYLFLVFGLIFVLVVFPPDTIFVSEILTSWTRRAWIVFVLLSVAWTSLLWMEYQHRVRLVDRVSNQVLTNYLQEQVSGFHYHPLNLVEDAKYVADGHMHIVRQTNQVWSQLSSEDRQRAENIAWVNIMLSSLWTLYEHDWEMGGLGTYTNDMYEEMLSSELNKLPPGFANLRLKTFDLGTNPPLIKGIKGFTIRNHTCLRHWEDTLYDSEDNERRKLPKEGFRAKIAEWEERLMRFASNEESTAFSRRRKHRKQHSTASNQGYSEIEERYTTVIEQLLSSFLPMSSVSRAATQKARHRRPTSNRNDVVDNADSRVNTTTEEKEAKDEQDVEIHETGRGWFDHFSVDCDRLCVDFDMVYASKDMDIVLTLRPSDLQSMVPEMTVTLSEVRFTGEVRLEMQLTSDYPFFGNATMSFTELPRVDFTLNSFGGLELSAIPAAYTFVNSSLHYLLRHYTYPEATALDLRHTLCPTCDTDDTGVITSPMSALQELSRLPQVLSLSAKRMMQPLRDRWKQLTSWWRRQRQRWMQFTDVDDIQQQDRITDDDPDKEGDIFSPPVHHHRSGSHKINQVFSWLREKLTRSRSPHHVTDIDNADTNDTDQASVEDSVESPLLNQQLSKVGKVTPRSSLPTKQKRPRNTARAT